MGPKGDGPVPQDYRQSRSVFRWACRGTARQAGTEARREEARRGGGNGGSRQHVQKSRDAEKSKRQKVETPKRTDQNPDRLPFTTHRVVKGEGGDRGVIGRIVQQPKSQDVNTPESGDREMRASEPGGPPPRPRAILDWGGMETARRPSNSRAKGRIPDSDSATMCVTLGWLLFVRQGFHEVHRAYRTDRRSVGCGLR